ncbi:SIMPL domain-containing protein [Granulicella pectinivorans]|nr:SIMPL domain-containing protein [Granulicella pectinivorans]
MRMTSIFVAPLLLASSLLSAQTVNSPSLAITKDNRTLSVSASDHAEAEPEVAEIHIGFTAYGMTLPETYKAASATSNGIVKALVDAGAQKSEIQSQSQQVARLQDYEVKAQKGMKFRVQQSWTVSVAPKDAALVLDAAIQAGANQSGDINWRMKNSVALDTEAIRRATERARLMATELAKGMGVTLGKPLYATNTVSNGLIAPRMMMSAMARSANSDQVAPLSIEAQRVQSEATVQVIYAIE